jgi:hypothetical protein
MSVVSQGILADVRAERRAIVDRFVAADALSPQRTLAVSQESLSADEQSLLEGFIARGTVVEFRGEYYLDLDALARETYKSSVPAIIGVVLLIGIVGTMLWYLRSAH